MNIQERIKKLIDEFYNGNKRAFSKAIGVTPTVIENIVGKRQGNPSFDITLKIINAFENMSVDWLMTGKGKLLKGNDTNLILSSGQGNRNNLSSLRGDDDASAENRREKESKEQHYLEKIESLEKVILAKEEVIKAQEEIISLLKESKKQ